MTYNLAFLEVLEVSPDLGPSEEVTLELVCNYTKSCIIDIKMSECRW